MVAFLFSTPKSLNIQAITPHKTPKKPAISFSPYNLPNHIDNL